MKLIPFDSARLVLHYAALAALLVLAVLANMLMTSSAAHTIIASGVTCTIQDVSIDHDEHVSLTLDCQNKTATLRTPNLVRQAIGVQRKTMICNQYQTGEVEGCAFK
jgi:hypothetical protein